MVEYLSHKQIVLVRIRVVARPYSSRRERIFWDPGSTPGKDIWSNTLWILCAKYICLIWTSQYNFIVSFYFTSYPYFISVLSSVVLSVQWYANTTFSMYIYYIILYYIIWVNGYSSLSMYDSSYGVRSIYY